LIDASKEHIQKGHARIIAFRYMGNVNFCPHKLQPYHISVYTKLFYLNSLIQIGSNVAYLFVILIRIFSMGLSAALEVPVKLAGT